MNRLFVGLCAGAFACVFARQALTAEVVAESVLHPFQINAVDGDSFYAGPISVGDMPYGTTELGGTHTFGTVFSIKPMTGTETLLRWGGNGGARPAARVTDCAQIVIYSFCGPQNFPDIESTQAALIRSPSRRRSKPYRRPPRGFELTAADYRLLADFRQVLRQFFVYSDEAAKQAGITAQQHRALLAIKASDGRPTIGDLANQLVIRHHSAVGLVDRLVRAGLTTRNFDPADRRRMTLTLTALGEEKLLAVSGANRQELRRLMPLLKALVTQLEA